MQTPARTLRTQADEANPRGCFFYPTTREYERHERIVSAATTLFAQFGRHAITFCNLAIGLRMAPATLRQHFADLESLLAEILTRHLKTIAAAIGELPAGDPDRAAKARQIYFDLTHTATGGLTPSHLILVRERHTLPPDLLPAIEEAYSQIGTNLGETPLALTLLDTTYTTLQTIETMLKAATTPTAPHAEPPAPEPQEEITLTPTTLKDFLPKPITWEPAPHFTLPEAHPPGAWILRPTKPNRGPPDP